LRAIAGLEEAQSNSSCPGRHSAAISIDLIVVDRSNMTSEKDEISSLDRVLTRLALTEEDKLEQV